MPEKSEHLKFCRSYCIECLFRMGSCPLDRTDSNGINWHPIHHKTGDAFLESWDFSHKKDNEIDDCINFLKQELDDLEDYFCKFVASFKLPSIHQDQMRQCWIAHIVTDYASDYYWLKNKKTLTSKNITKYRELFNRDCKYKEFVTKVADYFFNEGAEYVPFS